MNRRFVHLVVSNFVGHRCPYTLHSISTSGLFYQSRPNISAAAAIEDDLLPGPVMTYQRPCNPPAYYGCMDFMSLGRSRNDIVGVDHERRTILYDTAMDAIRTMPMMHGRKWFPVSLNVGDSLYVMNSRPGPPECHTFEALIHGRSLSSPGLDWYWRSLPPPPYVHDPGYIDNEGQGYGNKVDKPYDIMSFTVVGDSQIWVSTAAAGTYSFDTVSGVWSQPGDWSLPFVGRVEYVPEHNLWFGFSSQGNQFCTSDLTIQGLPIFQNKWELDAGQPRDLIATDSYVVPLGFGKFCIAKLFERLEEVVCGPDSKYKTERFVVLTGVVVERSNGNDGVEELTMIQHKSKRYSLLEEKMVNQVL